MRPKLTASDVAAIRARYAAGEGSWTIAKDYPVGARAVLSAAKGETWRGLPLVDLSGRVLRPVVYSGDQHPLHRAPWLAAHGEAHPAARLSTAAVMTILERSDEDPSALAEEFGVSKRCILDVIQRRRWRRVDSTPARTAA